MLGPTSTQRAIAWLLRWLLLALTVWLVAEALPGIHLEGLASTLAVALILGLLNLYIRPVLFILTFPLTLVTLGIFVIILNALLLEFTDWIAGSLDLNFRVETFWDAILGAALIAVVGFVLARFINAERIAQRFA